MNRSFIFAVLLISALCMVLPRISPAAASDQPKIDPALVAILAAQAPGAYNNVIVILSDQVDLRNVGGRTRRERQRNVVRQLRNRSTLSQRSLLSLLRQRKADGSVHSFTSLWIMNAITLSADSSVILELASLPSVREIVPDFVLQAPVRTTTTASSISGAVQPNISLINAPALWNLGFTGQGVVVANLDTGVDASHPDLAGRWRGGGNSWYDPYGQHATPFDANGHGTWTMGVMVGGSASGSAVGVAPNATWIAAKIYNDSGIATTSAIHQAFQWLLDPDGNPLTDDAPDVVNNSWALNNINGCDQTFQPDLHTLVAAGITPVFAAGNYGSSQSTSVSPPNNPDAFPVGAINNNSLVLSTSSRGPTSCGQSAPVIYPGVMAPGVNIMTTDLAGGYYTVSGTSLAAPHVAGGIALLLNAFPAMTVAQTEQALMTTAIDLGVVGPDNNYGMGRIDLLAAYQLLLTLSQYPTATATPVSVTDMPTATAAATDTPVATSTAIPPTATATSTPVPPTATATSTAIPPTATATSTPAPPTATATSTAIPPTATATSTPAPPTATATSTPAPPTATATSTPVPPTATAMTGFIFSDGFETGGFGKWTSAATGNGKLSVSTAAAIAEIYGMQATLSANTPIYLTDSSPIAESSYHARFWMNPNSATIPAGTALDQFIGRTSTGAAIFRVQIRYYSGAYQVRGVTMLAGGSTATTSWYPITNGRHALEVAWQAASSVSSADGTFSLWVDGTLKQTKQGLANGAYRVEEVRLGPASGLSSGISGTEYFDSFVSHRTAYIGP